MRVLQVEHSTIYRYARPVRFGEHRLMFRPRDSHDLRLLGTGLQISPQARVHWMHDVFSNSIAIARFDEPAAELRVDSWIRMAHYGLENPEFMIEPYARTYPFSYASEEVPDLGRTIERHFPDPEHKLDLWAKGFLNGGAAVGTQDLLVRITRAVREQFAYSAREEPGVQPPLETLRLGSGSCRDLALFMMEAVRSLGLAAHFVTGYLYDPAVDGAGPAMQGAGATHAWVQVYLPGAGWVECDPTNGLIGGANLIRVAVVRDPRQAVPLQGTFEGAREDFLGMEVTVQVTGAPAE